MNFKGWLSLSENFKKTPLLNNLHNYLTTQQISDQKFMIEFLNWFRNNEAEFREINVDWKDAKKPYVLDNETNPESDDEDANDPDFVEEEFFTSEIEMYLNDTLKFNLNKDFKHVEKIKEFLYKPENYYTYLREFKHYILHDYLDESNESNPAHRYFIFKRLLNQNNWLIHFSSEAKSIKRNGFQIGIENINDLPLSRVHTHTLNKSGYNYAYLVKGYDNPSARMTYLFNHYLEETANSGLLMFKSSGVIVDHLVDQEEQVIFDGTSVNPKKIVLILPDQSSRTVFSDSSITKDYKNWIVKSQNPEIPDPFYGSILDAINWVKNNWKNNINVIF
jgi:hypothetical protein